MVVLTAIDLDNSPERPVEVGYEMATAFDDTLVVVHVISEEEVERKRTSRESLPSEFQGTFTVDQALDSVREKALAAVDAAIDDFDSDRVDARGRVGDAAEEIVALAAELDARYVVVGGRRQSVARQALFGSVSQAVMREVDRPVVTVMEPPE